MTNTYRIVRFYQLGIQSKDVIGEGLTLEEAQAHCKDPETSSSTAQGLEARALTERVGPWFDGYEEE